MVSDLRVRLRDLRRLKCFSGLAFYFDILEKSKICDVTSNTPFCRKKY